MKYSKNTHSGIYERIDVKEGADFLTNCMYFIAYVFAYLRVLLIFLEQYVRTDAVTKYAVVKCMTRTVPDKTVSVRLSKHIGYLIFSFGIMNFWDFLSSWYQFGYIDCIEVGYIVEKMYFRNY